MATFNPRRFSKPETLRMVAREHLIAFLRPHAAYFTARGVELPSNQTQELDYDTLSDVLLSSDTTTPPELAESLYYVDELSTQEGFDSIQEAIDGTEFDATISDEITCADLAIQVWMRNRDLIERLHAEQFLHRPRSFEYFMTTGEIQDCRKLDEVGLRALESDLNDWFEKKRRGRTAKVFVYRKPDFIWFLVRHGEPFTREPSLKAGNEEGSEYFRPMKFDLLVYNPNIGEIRVNATSKGEKQLYRKHFGGHFFGDDEYFDSTAKFTLDPLREDGADAVLCGDIDGLEEIKLKEIQIFRGGTHKEIEIRKAEDIFAALAERERDLSKAKGLFKASFSVKFTDSKTPRTVTLSGNKAQYKRDDDSEILEQWFAARGFVNVREGD